MKILALLTSAGINIGVCVLLLSLYSILRKQPGNVNVYFGRRIAEEHKRLRDAFVLERIVPSPSWILKALQYTEEEILAAAGLDAVVFMRIVIFSIRIFSIAAVVCLCGILPLNYFGQDMEHRKIPSESLDIFTIGNVVERSKWLWVHCVALCIVSCSACVLLYFEYKRAAKMRLIYLTRSAPNPSHFTILVRGIPKSTEESYNDTVTNFFTKYHASSYLSHQIVYKAGKVQKMLTGAKMAFEKFMHIKHTVIEKKSKIGMYRCGLCGCSSNSFQLVRTDFDQNGKKIDISSSDTSIREHEECGAAFVFFKTRYGALVASEILQTWNPMLWVTELAPAPDDVYWSNLWVPYRLLWMRRIATLLLTIVYMFVFLIPVTFVQGLTQLDQLQQRFPFLKGILKNKYVILIVTGYLPSVILQLSLYTVPPMMMLFSTMEGPTSRSGRKKSASWKVLYFTIWNVFFVNVLSGSVISQINALSIPKDIPTQLAKAVPRQATFFITYVLTSGWASLSSEVMQLFGLIWNLIRKYILGREEDPIAVPSFPYHTEVPKLLLFGLLGFTCSILAPLILPFLLIYFFLGYVVYRNQMMNVYCSRYETGGLMWPIVHNTTIFSLVLTQLICLGVFSLKKSPVAAGFTIPLILLTLLFNEYCRKRFYPLFKSFSAQDIINMDREDEQSGRLEEIHEQLHTAYSQFTHDTSVKIHDESSDVEDQASSSCKSNGLGKELSHPTLKGLPTARLQKAVRTVCLVVNLQKKASSV
ncbi:CSC1-like protein RXW8 [Carex littledalei]|uniref:CSC1-like protein RXW8 n=1 Tax=Carex littledalei TaxID=544730 RepID=A0A833Q610_9POAL|nr:CSC1-like protein RXW8 [Carex littledalei]